LHLLDVAGKSLSEGSVRSALHLLRIEPDELLREDEKQFSDSATNAYYIDGFVKSPSAALRCNFVVEAHS
jgi:hypothetical protein